MKAINRIKKSEDFAFVIKNGTAKRNGSFVVHTKKNELGYARIGISVSSRLGHAVIRNRIKRQMRAICGQIVDMDSTSFDIIVIAKSDFLNHSYDENKELLTKLITQQVGK